MQSVPFFPSHARPGPHSNGLAGAFLEALCQGRYRGDVQQWNKSHKEFANLLESDNPGRPLDAYSGYRDAQLISATISETACQRRLVFLGRGYYGLASVATRTDDVCTIIFGTRSPFILRKVSGEIDHYKVVGGAYVNSKVYITRTGRICGLGESERCEDWREWDLPTEDIILC